MQKYLYLTVALITLICCTKESNEVVVDKGDGITFNFIEGLNDDPKYQLKKDNNGYYYFFYLKISIQEPKIFKELRLKF